MDLSEDEKDDYGTAKQRLLSKLTPASFEPLNEFHRWKLLPGEVLSVFVHHLKELLGKAMPNLNATAHDQLLLHHFVVGLPQSGWSAIESDGRGQGGASPSTANRLSSL